ncbi:hypothetical protein RHMOL_Rhmol08G0200200 [Rhododendron molle]|uniref:Uncharacterized protein n=1 Tax=Rhododendron molle TaxID=49168 RepID=A0ACC0MRP0_RHOML|nr:hypothetical protein RHMOL_Rhmol08G0200200 [Rhododendron molle]
MPWFSHISLLAFHGSTSTKTKETCSLSTVDSRIEIDDRRNKLNDAGDGGYTPADSGIKIDDGINKLDTGDGGYTPMMAGTQRERERGGYTPVTVPEMGKNKAIVAWRSREKLAAVTPGAAEMAQALLDEVGCEKLLVI